jgi:glycerol-3-phosphate O-acyltransferase/dihydroxyacetone phosphate acyltransferase
MAQVGRRPQVRDRFLAFVARVLARSFFRSVEVEGAAPDRGPVILAASHLNGFVDPVLLVAQLGRLPRFLAKATLWNVVPARPLLSFARAIPVQRRVDAGDATDNTRTFGAAVDALAEGGTLAVFPEGTTHDDPAIRPLHTGVARIALQAAAAGVEDVRIVPVGITYEDKVAVRGRALIHFGPAMEVPAVPQAVPAGGAAADPAGEAGPASEVVTAGTGFDPDRHEVRELTDELAEAIRATTPDFASTEEALALTRGADVALRPLGALPGSVPLTRSTALARRLAEAPRAEVDHLVDVVARYHLLLGAVGLTDDQLVANRHLRTLGRRTAWLAVLVVLLAPFALVGFFTNLVPALIVLAAGLVPRAPVSKGTVRLLVAALVFPLTWLVIAVWDVGAGFVGNLLQRLTFPLDPVVEGIFGTRGGFWPSVLVFVAIPVLGFVALLFVERSWALLQDWTVWRALLDRRGQLGALRERRAEVVAVTRETAGEGGD